MKIGSLIVLIVCFSNGNSQKTRNDICIGMPDGSFIADPTDKECKYFYRCVKNTGALIKCPGTLLFNPKLSTCDAAENVECNVVTEAPTTTPLATTILSTTPKSTTSSPIITTTESTSICGNSMKMGIRFMPSPENCEIYYICYGDQEMEMKCMRGTHWNMREKMCDLPLNANCELEIKPTQLSCPRSGSVYIEDPKSCERFIYCRDGYMRYQKCPPLQYWDPDHEMCVYKWLVSCIKN